MQLIPDSWGSRLREDNDCHNPKGSPEGGRFCSTPGRSTVRARQPRLSQTAQRLLLETDNRLHPGFVTISRYAGTGPYGGPQVGGVRDSAAAAQLVKLGLLVFERRHSSAVGRRGHTVHVSDTTFKVTDEGIKVRNRLAGREDAPEAEPESARKGSSSGGGSTDRHEATLRKLIDDMGYLAKEGRPVSFGSSRGGPGMRDLPEGVSLAAVKKAVAEVPELDGWRFTYTAPEVQRSQGGKAASQAGRRVESSKRYKYKGAKIRVERA